MFIVLAMAASSGRIIRLQVAYRDSLVALVASQAIASAKLRNCRHFLGNYLRSRRRYGYDSAPFLLACRNRLARLSSRISLAKNRQALFLLEAQAGASYWRTYALLCRQDESWRREYPHAGDPLNVLLNSGYTFLLRFCRQALAAAGLSPAIGIWHGESSPEPLAYDFMECFRQPAVDMVIVPYYSRRRPISQIEDTFKKIEAHLAYRYQKSFWYRGQCQKLERIIFLEAVRLRQAILKKEVWEPYQHRWSHRRACRW